MLYKILKFLSTPLLFLLYRIKVEGLNNIPKGIGFIICSNHIKAIDPFFVGCAIPNRIIFMAKSELFKNRILEAILNTINVIPIKRGEADLRSIKACLKILKEGQVLGIFPEGTRNITDVIKAEPGVSMLAIKAKVPVIPIAIISNYKLFSPTTIRIGSPKLYDEFYDTKLNNNDYTNLSIDLMKNIKQMIDRGYYENNIR